MVKRIIKFLSVIAVVVFILTEVNSYILQTSIMKTNTEESCNQTFDEIKKIINQNKSDLSAMKQTVNQDSLTRARTFALMIEQKPSLLTSQGELEKIKKALNVDELHVTDEKGILKWGTHPQYFGVDFSTNEQTKPFMPCLTDKNFELAQEPQPNTSGVIFQYVSVPRTDKTGIVQIGLAPTRLEKMLENNKIENVLNSVRINKTGFVTAIDKESGIILSTNNKSFIGKKYSEIGIGDNIFSQKNKSGYVDLDKKSMFYSVCEFDNKIFVATISQEEIIGQRNYQILMNIYSNLIIYFVLFLVIYFIIRKIVIKGLIQISTGLNEIADGNLDKQLDVRTNPEFSNLCDNINKMVDSLKIKISETENLIQNQNHIIADVNVKAQEMKLLSEKMEIISENLAQGSTEQAGAIEELFASISSVSEQSNITADHSVTASNLSKLAEQEIIDGNSYVQNMADAIIEIKNTSEKINQIINTIDEIAFQTNILAINASVEAAHAGSAGKGFAVVAEEVSQLASKCANAVESTTILIETVADSIEKGMQKSKETTDKLKSIVEKSKQSNEVVSKISDLANEQTSQINQITKGLEQISTVVQNTSISSEQSADISKDLNEKVNSLRELMKQLDN